MNFAVSARTLTSKQPAQLPPPSFILNSTTVTFSSKLSTNFNSFKTLLLVLLLRLYKSTHITPILKSLLWLKVNERISLSPTKFLQPLNLAIFTTLISLQPSRSTRSSSVVTLSRPPTISLKITDRSFRYASLRLGNQLSDSFRQPHPSCLDSSAHPLVNLSHS